MRSRPMVAVVSVVQPVTFLCLVAGTRQLDSNNAFPVVAAVLLTSMWSAIVWTAGGVLRRERTYGTLVRSVTSVYSPSIVVFGRSLGAMLSSLAAIVLSCSAVVVALRIPVELATPAWLGIALLLTVLSGTTLGMLLSCLFLMTRHGLAWSSALIYPVFLLGGLLIPPDRLPLPVRWVPSLLSLHWIYDMVIHSWRGQTPIEGFIIGASLTLIYGALAVVFLRRAVLLARRRGTLELG